jgi:hypothetical protein
MFRWKMSPAAAKAEPAAALRRDGASPSALAKLNPSVECDHPLQAGPGVSQVVEQRGQPVLRNERLSGGGEREEIDARNLTGLRDDLAELEVAPEVAQADRRMEASPEDETEGKGNPEMLDAEKS